MLQLWEQTKNFIIMKAGQYARGRLIQGKSLNGCDHDDLTQAGYFALLAAIKYFTQDTQYTFLTFLNVTLKNAFGEALNIKTKRVARDALNGAESLDRPLFEDGDNLCESIVDESTEGEGSVEEKVARAIDIQHLRKTLEKSLSQLPAKHNRIIRERYFERLTLNQIGERHGYSKERARQLIQWALDKMYECQNITGLDAYVDERTKFHKCTGFKSFKEGIWTSHVEHLAIMRERIAQKWLREAR